MGEPKKVIYKTQTGGTSIDGDNFTVGGDFVAGNIQVGGDMVKGDKVGGDKVAGDKTVVTAGRDAVMGNQTITTTTTTGLSADDVAKLFDSIYKRVEQHPAEDQPDIRKAVDTIKAAATQEAVEGKKPDEEAVKAASQTLALNAPDLLTDMADVALATLANPAAGVVTLIRKIAQKAKSLRSSAA